LERVKGIEPSSSAWKAVALPLSYTRATSIYATNSRPRLTNRHTDPVEDFSAEAPYGAHPSD
jgi:hypothetical protein